MTQPRRRMTPDQVQACIDARTRNRTLDSIAAEIGFSLSAVRLQLLKAGVDPSIPPRQPGLRRQTSIRSGRKVHPFTVDEDRALLDLAKAGKNYSAIARTLTESFPGRPRRHHTIINRLQTLARWDARAEAAAEGNRPSHSGRNTAP